METSLTNRPQFKFIWSQDAQEKYAAVDPDTDTKHQIFQADKYNKGWVVEKEPEQWQNYLQLITDMKLLELLENGFFNWFDDVTYIKNSLCFNNGVLYISLVDGNINNTPSQQDTTSWTQVYTLSASDYDNGVADLLSKVSSHVTSTGNSNPHEDDVATIGGYTQQEIDNMFSAGNTATMAHHIADKDNPHNVTCAQLKILPIEGGVFTGIVNFSGGLNYNKYYIGWIH
ncbi:hypothetical protein ACEV6Q_04325 [Enterobacter ludwigii]|uniref:hypothetical protein n=1 Tax=Enterobacter ludwigii TaxID=299767 RepID=UPI003BEEDE0B